MKIAVLVLAAAATLTLVGCGGGGSRRTTSTACRSAAAVRALARLRADVAVLRRAAARPTTNTLQGNAASSHATDRFLHDVEMAPIDNLVRNRQIDHAAAAVAGSCQQCFQALEAARPIPAIAQGGRGTCSK